MNTEERAIYRNTYDAAEGYITMEWSGYANSQQFREGTEQMFRELVHHRATKVLGNIKDMVLISLEDQVWLIDYFLPKAIAAGFKAVALVRPVHYFNKVAIETVAYKVNQEKLRIQIFNDIDEAREWLRKFPG
jgi:hypothetical protein